MESKNKGFIPNKNRPYSNCPFKKDTQKGWLKLRIKQILEADTFTCHKDQNLQCAGHMLLLKNKN